MVDKLNVIIPVWRGRRLLPRSLKSLLIQQTPMVPVCVAVVINDNVPEERELSFRLAISYAMEFKQLGFEYHVLNSTQGRRNALIAGEAVLGRGATLYLDQDAILSPGALKKLAHALCASHSARFATCSLRFTRSPSLLVRAFLRCLSSMPYFSESPVTAGLYGVSVTGRELWDWHAMPLDVGDDKYIRLLFAPSDRCYLPCESYEVVSPQTYWELLESRTRYARMNRAISSVSSSARRRHLETRRWAGVIQYLLIVRNWPGALLVGITLSLAYVRAYR